ncbi:MAG: DMT family transporter [Chloroflexota bacterium]|nr:DMT family transporter [Chloroflexota bacterium]
MGEAAALTAAMGWAVASIALTSVSVRLPALVVGGLQSSFASVILVAILIGSGQFEDLTTASATTLLAVVTSGIVGFAVAEPVYVRTLSILGMQRTYPVAMGLFILFSTTGGVLILGERFTVGLVIGGVLIIGGAYLIAAFRQEQLIHAQEPAPTFAGAGGPRTATAPVALWARSRRLQGYALLLAVPVLWTTATIVLAGAGDHVGPIPAAGLRVPVGAALLMALLLLTRRRELESAVRRRRDMITIAGAGIAGIVIASLLFVYALFDAGAARTAVLTSTSPLFAIPLAIVFLGERLTRYVLLGTALSVVGIIVVVSF